MSTTIASRTVGRVSALVVALALLTIVAPAGAAVPGTGASSPAVDQYVESVPTAGGDPRKPGGGGPAPGVKRKLEGEGGADAAALEAVASSPALGAPDSDGRRRASRADIADSGSNPRPSALEALTSAAVSDDGGAGGWLIAGLALLTVALAGTALARRRSLTR
jgi:hypothetical protein